MFYIFFVTSLSFSWSATINRDDMPLLLLAVNAKIFNFLFHLAQYALLYHEALLNTFDSCHESIGFLIKQTRWASFLSLSLY